MTDIHGNVCTHQNIGGRASTTSAVNGELSDNFRSRVVGDYNPLINHPRINNIELIGNKTSADLGIPYVFYNTTEYWDTQSTLVAIEGAIYIYSDYKQDELGRYIPGIKVGDGTTQLIDLPFIIGNESGGDVSQIKIGNITYDPVDGVVTLPSYPSVNDGSLTIKRNGVTIQTFSADQAANVIADILVPTQVSQLVNDAGYTTNVGTVTEVKIGSVSYPPTNGIVSIPEYPTVPTKVSELINDSGYTSNTGTVTTVKVGDTPYESTDGTVNLPAYPTDTNTHRPIHMNDAEILGDNVVPLNLKSGNNVTLSNSGGNVTINAIDTTYESKAGVEGGTEVSLVTTGEKYYWNHIGGGGGGDVSSIKIDDTIYDPVSGVVTLPSYPVVNNGSFTIQKNGTPIETFYANQSTDIIADITVPTKVSELTNDSGYVTTDRAVQIIQVGNIYHVPENGLVVLPAYPTVNNGKLTIKRNSVDVCSFGANQSGIAIADIEVPTKVSELTNDAGYTTNLGTVTSIKIGTTSYSPTSGIVEIPEYPTMPTKTSQLLNDSNYVTSDRAVMRISYNNITYMPSDGTLTLPVIDEEVIQKPLPSSSNSWNRVLLDIDGNSTESVGNVYKADTLAYNKSLNSFLETPRNAPANIDEVSSKLIRSNDPTNNVTESHSYVGGYNFKDNESKYVGWMANYFEPDGSIVTQIQTQNTTTNDEDVYNYINVIANKDGTGSYAVGYPSAFRNAIGAAPAGWNVGGMSGGTTPIAIPSGANELYFIVNIGSRTVAWSMFIPTVALTATEYQYVNGYPTSSNGYISLKISTSRAYLTAVFDGTTDVTNSSYLYMYYR